MVAVIDGWEKIGNEHMLYVDPSADACGNGSSQYPFNTNQHKSLIVLETIKSL